MLNDDFKLPEDLFLFFNVEVFDYCKLDVFKFRDNSFFKILKFSIVVGNDIGAPKMRNDFGAIILVIDSFYIGLSLLSSALLPI